MSQFNKLIDTIIKDRMLTCQCTDDGRVCMRCQYDALKEDESIVNVFKGIPGHMIKTVGRGIFEYEHVPFDAKNIMKPEPKPPFERVPEGAFKIAAWRGTEQLCYEFGNRQLLIWNSHSLCYEVIREIYLDQAPTSPYLIPTTFGELKPGEWFRIGAASYRLKIEDHCSASACFHCDVISAYHSNSESVLRVSEVMP